MDISRSLHVLATLILFCATAQAQVITSDFLKDTDGWTAPNALKATLNWNGTGGNPTGYVYAQTSGIVDPNWNTYYLIAPSKFQGKLSAYYGGSLTFDAAQDKSGPAYQPTATAVIQDAIDKLTIYYFPAKPFAPSTYPSWTNFQIPLSATGEWKTANSTTAPTATAAQIQTVLANVSALAIQGLYVNADATTSFDNINMYPAITISKQPSGASVCVGATATFSVVATGNPKFSYQWQIQNAAGGWTDLTDGKDYTGSGTATLSVYTGGTVADGSVYQCIVSGIGGVNDATTNAVKLTINPLPAAPTTTGASGCNPASVVLSAAGGTNGQYTWYTAAGAVIPSEVNSTYTTPLLTTTTSYYVTINNGVCESNQAVVTATINTTTPPTTTGAAICGTGTVVLNAAGGSAGQYRWYTVSSGGTAIAGQTSSTYTTPSISTTTTYYVSINNGTCESTRTAVTATINTIPAAPTTTGAAICGTGTVVLNAAGGSAGQYVWYTVSSGGTAIAGQTNSTYTTPSISTTTIYYVSINNGTCESSRTAVTATINTIPAAPTTTGAAICGTGTVVLNAAGGSAGQYVWYTVSSGGTAIAGQTNSTYTTPSLSTTTTYYVSINNGTCESTRTAVTATINTIPAAPTTTGAAICGTGTVVLNAAGGSAGQYVWYTVSSGGTAIAGQTNSTYTTPSLSTTTTYYVSINNGTCESTRTAVTATINTIPAAPTTTGAAICGTGTVVLNAAGGSAGQYRWYTVSSGGTAIAGPTSSTYTTPSISTTTTYYVSINNGTCESTRTAVTATINTIPAAPTTTGAAICGTGTVGLNAAGGSAGQYRWYTVSSVGTAIAGQTNSTYTTPSLSTTTTYYVSINNGTCESTRTAVTATINTIPAAPTTTGAAICGTGTVVLNAAGGSAGQYVWYTVSSGGTAIAGQTSSTYTTPSISTTTTYYVSINNGTCESSRTAVTATINTIPAAPTTTGASGCNPSSVVLTAAGGTNGQYRWYTVSSGGTAISGEVNSTYTTPSLTTTTNFYVSINNGCESSRTLVVATINNLPTAPGVTDGSRCGPGTVVVNASGGAAGQYRWYTISSGGTAIAGETSSSYTTPSITTTTNYYVSIDNGTCESTRSQVVATINNPPSAPGVTGNSGCAPANMALTASGGSAGQYRWYTVSSGGTAINGETNNTYTTPPLSSTTTYYVSIDNGICEGPRTAVVATVNALPPAPTTTGGSACAPASVTLSASGASAGQYRWYSVASGGTAISGEASSSYNTPTLSTTTTYYVAINNGCEGPRTPVVATLNTPPSAPTTIGDFSCVAASITLKATGGQAGQYRWYTVSSGGTAISGAVNSSFTTPVISSTTTYYVSVNDGTCESPRTAVAATIGGAECTSNSPPVIETTEASTGKGGEVTINLKDLISDSDDNLVLSTLTIVSQPSSGATATIDANFNLVIDYAGKPFTGTESITISVCDSFSACTEQTLSIEVIASINVYNAVSPNKDGKNDYFIIDGIDKLQDTKVNHVAIFNRWGDVVWEGHNYDNVSVVFSGYSKNNAELPSGTYFYKIEFPGGKKTETGYLTLKR